MAYTQTQLDAIQDAYVEGVTKVTFNGRTIEYRSLKEMKSIMSDIQNSIKPINDAQKAYFPNYGRGF